MGQREIMLYLKDKAGKHTAQEIAYDMKVNPQSAIITLKQLWRFGLIKSEVTIVRQKPRKSARVWYM